MTIQEFAKTYYPFAKMVEDETQIPATFILAQSALETGWGKYTPGNMMFGVKDTDGVNGNEQLLTTTEYHSTDKKKYPVILWIKKVGAKLFKYRIKDYFRKYETPFDSFLDHAKFLQSNKRYKPAFEYKDARMFAKAVAVAGYATDTEYYKKLEWCISQIEKHIEKGNS